jgi:E3 ubiquitin-protein ligase TRIP12
MHNDDGEESPFSVLVKKLQDLLSRSEHFEVVTVHQNYEGNRSSASMLAKQLRLKLVAEEDSDIPRSYRNIMVSIHAIATFKALEDYLKPRIFISERPRVRRDRSSGLQGALAAFAAAAGLPHPGTSGLPPPGSGEGASSSSATPPTSKQSKIARRTGTRNPSGSGAGSSASAPKAPTPHSPEQEQLECMDERPMPDDDEMGDMDVLDDLDREMEDKPAPETGAVNMEVAGGKVTARKDDGTRVATPSTSTPSTATPSGRASTSSPRTSNRPNYSSPTASMDSWHIEFSINGHPISTDMTIYKAVQLNRNVGSEEPSYRNIWSAVHPITFRRVPGAAPPDGPLSPGSDNSQPLTSMPASLDKNKITSSILQLLSVLHALNANIDDVFQDVEVGRPQAQPLSQFVNTKLTAKLNRQLEEPLIVASACLPSWSEDLSRFYPFLFPFETRHLYLQSTSFGYSRSMVRWQNSQQSGDSRQDRHRDDNRPFLGRLQRQKVRIARDRILESAIKVMEIYGASPSVLEVEYFDEVGTGLGPTLEFYSSVSRAFVSKKLKLWRENDAHKDSEYVFADQGLFPAPMTEKMASSENGKKVLHLFKIMGKFVARSMLDSRIIDIFFNPTFFRTGSLSDSAVPPSLGAVKTVDKNLASSLKLLRKFAMAKKSIEENPVLTHRGKQERLKEISFDGTRVEDLEIYFTLPGYDEIELIPGGADVKVTIHNVGEYVDKVIDMTLGSGVKKQVEAFRAGFSEVFPYNALRSFTPDELVMLFGQVEEDWSLESELLHLFSSSIDF